MPSRFVLQPNGLLARFSSIVDSFTDVNLTPDEALEVAMGDMGRQEAQDKVERGLKDEIPYKPGVYGDGTSRWKDCLDTIKAIHGEDAYNEALRECSTLPPENIFTRVSIELQALSLRLANPDANDDATFRAIAADYELVTNSAEFAKRFGTSRSTISRWKTGASVPHSALRPRIYQWLRKLADKKIQCLT